MLEIFAGRPTKAEPIKDQAGTNISVDAADNTEMAVTELAAHHRDIKAGEFTDVRMNHRAPGWRARERR